MVRYDAASPKGKGMLRIMAEGVARMKRMDLRNPQSWQFQWYTHMMPVPQQKYPTMDRLFPNPADWRRRAANGMWNMCQSHAPKSTEAENYQFLPWHRMYVYYFEDIIRNLTRQPQFTLPYWNYLNPATAAIPEEFRMPNDPVFGSLYADTRKPEINNGQPLTGINDDCLKLTQFYDRPGLPSSGFAQNLNNGLHGQIHDLVGNSTHGMGSINWAARDPIFWMHHCMVDRLWASWNQAGGRDPTNAEWMSARFTFVNGNRDLVMPYTGDVTSTQRMGYIFDINQPVPGVEAPSRFMRSLAQKDNMVVAGLAGSMLGGRGAHAGHGAMKAPGAVTLSGKSVSAALEFVEGNSRLLLRESKTFAGLSEAESTPGSLYLVLDNLSAPQSPGTTYDVMLHQEGAASEASRVGGLSFFAAVGHSAHVAPIGMTYDVTHLAGSIGDKPVVTLVAKGEASGKTPPVVGAIRLIRG